MTSRMAFRKLLTLSLVLALATPGLAAPGGAATRGLRKNNNETVPAAPKIAPDLEELLGADDEQARESKTTVRTLAAKRSEKLARRQVTGGLVLPSEAVAADEKQSFIVQVGETASVSALRTKLASLGGTVRQTYSGAGLVAIEAPRAAIRQLAADGAIGYVSPDRPVMSNGSHVGKTVGWYNTGIIDAGDANTSTWLTGGVGNTVIIDSGVFSTHNLLKWDGPAGQQKVAYNQDFTGQAISGDPFGHGTHVASMLASDWSFGNSAYEGIGSGNPLISLRALDSNGVGAASNVVAAINWCVTNKANWNIRVINLSLGSMAKDSYTTDPLCVAARAAVNAGIVVVAAAGNDGKSSTGAKIYGGIHSPGNDPSVITVGAANTFGTDARSDDTVATFSSRGPTRSYKIVSGVRKYDNLIKPDLIAPGNKLIGARANYNNVENQLAANNAGLRTGSATAMPDKLMYLSGTSMSTPIVAAAASLLIQTNPNLTPNLIKAILMYSAQPLAGFNTFEQGAGMLNVDGAIRLARLVKTTMPTTNGAALLNVALPASQTSVIAGQTIKWGQGVNTNFGFLYGSALLQYWQAVYARGSVLSDATVVSAGSLIKVAGKTATGVLLRSGSVRIGTSGAILSDGVVLTDGVALSDGVVLTDGVALADGSVLSDGVILADGRTRADTTLRSESAAAFLGDNTAGMPPAP
ncbi:MAG: S8 family serine peptidase [Blastocatellia bacterium]